jgi:hypothetical protein
LPLTTVTLSALPLSTLPLSATSETNTTTAATKATTTTVCYTTNPICSSSAKIKTPTTSIPAPTTTNKTQCSLPNQNLKRHRDNQSPNGSRDVNGNKKQRNKAQTATQKTLKEYWLAQPNSSNRFELLAQDDEDKNQTDNGISETINTQMQIEPKKTKPPLYMYKMLKIYMH